MTSTVFVNGATLTDADWFNDVNRTQYNILNNAADAAAARVALSLGVGSLTSYDSLTQFFYPANGSAFQDMYRSGWLPSWFNQQWGGAQWGTLPDGSFGSVATGNVQDDATQGIGLSAANYYGAQGFTPSEPFTLDTIWLKLSKSGNPATVTCRIYSNSVNSPSATIGSASAISGKLITSKTDGEWYQFTGLAAALTANTKYHITLTVGTATGSDYVFWKATTSNKYPGGNCAVGTSGPVWTPTTTVAFCFLIQNPAANSLIQSSGMFDYKLAFNPGTPVNQSRSVAQPLANFYDGKTCSVLYRGTYAVSTNVWDFTYGIDHDRITLTIDASGYPVLTIYESDRTVATVTGTGSVAAGNHDVGIRVRTVADGADYATLYVDGVSVGTPLTAQTFTMDVNMVTLGTARLGDGFGIIPAWTQDMQMTSLPSAQGWTWSGTATEANAMSIQGGKLYQNANGYTSTQTGYYQKTVVLNNTTGWTVSWKGRTAYDTNSTSSSSVAVVINDGAKLLNVTVHEYFLSVYDGAWKDGIYQADFKSQDHVFTVCGKGSDYYVFVDGKLAVDGTGLLTSASATNTIGIGDQIATASVNADAIWSYVKYYQGGMILPTAGSNTCSEFAHWSGDKSALYASLWNSGTPVSVKQLCGVPRNYQFEQVVQREVRRGVTSGPSTTSTTPVLLTDMEAYVIGSDIRSTFRDTETNSTAVQTVFQAAYLDGKEVNRGQFVAAGASYNANVSLLPQNTVIPLGLHKQEVRWFVSANTATARELQRTLTVEARS
jgi:hypothetical protein